jgi:uncharacterized protein DUF2635
MFVKPAPGVLVRDPVTKQLLSAAPVEGVRTTVVPKEGMEVGDHDFFWLRRIRDRDAVKVTADAAASTSTNVSAVVADPEHSEGPAENGAN